MSSTKKAQIRLIVGMAFIAALAIFLLSMPFPTQLYGYSKLVVIIPIVFIAWIAYLKYAIPRCPKCGYSVISVLEIKGIPIIVKMPSSDKCTWCREAVK